ncbi:MAG: 4-hydroxy-tetrahydrodipicolinate reductase [Verrucomicrobiia bacterium]
MVRVLLNGYKGRMGQAILGCAQKFPEIAITGRVDLGDRIEEFIENSDVVIDFSYHSATPAVAQVCAKSSKALVIGTTGHSEDEKKIISAAAEKIPIVWSSNYSTGVNTLFWLVKKTAEILGSDYDNEIVEIHHRLKKDAPSGTAITLAEILASVRDKKLSELARYGRQGIVGERSRDEIGIHSVRAGDVVGEHTVIFATSGERLELTHKASSREAFASGALKAAIWINGKPAGIYSMMDVLGLK